MILALIGLCGASLKIGLTLPFDIFMSPLYSVPFMFDVKGAELCVFVPESNPIRNTLFNLCNSMQDWKKGKLTNVLYLKKSLVETSSDIAILYCTLNNIVSFT